jgi:gliding motility-associated-like protein
MEEFKELDDLFKKGLENAQVSPPPGVWEGIASSVTATTAAGQTSVWLVAAKWCAGALVAAGVTYIAVLTLTDKNEPEKNAGRTNTEVSQVQAPELSEGHADVSNTTPPLPEHPEKPGTTQGPALNSDGNGYSDHTSGSDDVRSESGEIRFDKLDRNTGTEDRYPKNPLFKNSTDKAPLASEANTTTECKHTVSISFQRVSGNAYSFTALNPTGLVTWYFGDGSVESGIVTSHQFGNIPAVYTVKVLTISPAGCRDSSMEKIVVAGQKPELKNVFTPEGDGFNDEYVVMAPNVVYYDLSIYDLQGRKVFSSNDPNVSWNGKCGGILCPDGRYRATLAYKYPGDTKPNVVQEIITLTRVKLDGN